MARRAARQAVWPKEKRVLMEFIRTENGPMDADLLFQNLYNNYKKDFEIEKEKIFFEELNRYHKYGFGEKRILELYARFGYQYPKEANEEDSYIKKAIEKGYLKSEYELNQITEKLVIDLIKIYEKGELTEEELKTEIKNLFEHESGEWMSE